MITTPIRPSKDIAVRKAIELAPMYSELFDDMRRNGEQTAWPDRIGNVRENLNFYITLYEDETRIGSAIALAFFGIENFAEFNRVLKDATKEEQQVFVDQVASMDEEDVNAFLVGTLGAEQDWEASHKVVAALSEDEREKVLQEGMPYWLFFFSSFFNTMALMVHGARMTTLVPQATVGDDVAFLKAVHIDRMLLLHHPYFRERKRKAQEERDMVFLRKLLNQESKSLFHSKIRYPGLYMLFGILDSFRWLDDLKHEEILDIADEAGLDRFQNRIEDVNYLTKRLTEYRRWQKTSI